MLPVMQDTRGNSIRLSDGAVVCGCNTVGKNAVVAAGEAEEVQGDLEGRVEDNVPDGGMWMGDRLAAVDEGGGVVAGALPTPPWTSPILATRPHVRAAERSHLCATEAQRSRSQGPAHPPSILMETEAGLG